MLIALTFPMFDSSAWSEMLPLVACIGCQKIVAGTGVKAIQNLFTAEPNLLEPTRIKD